MDSKKDFRQKVLLVLKNQVKFGETISYGDLARLSGSPKAAQAVGSAVSNNPISFVIPCHRVIKSDGSIGNYSKGIYNRLHLIIYPLRLYLYFAQIILEK